MSKIPEPRDQKDIFRVPIGIPINVPTVEELDEQIRSDIKANEGSRRKNVVNEAEEKQDVLSDSDKEGADSDNLKDDDLDDLLAPLDNVPYGFYKHVSCLGEFNIYDIYIRPRDVLARQLLRYQNPTKESDKKLQDYIEGQTFSEVLDAKNRNVIVFFQLLIMFILSVLHLMDWNVLVSQQLNLQTHLYFEIIVLPILDDIRSTDRQFGGDLLRNGLLLGVKVLMKQEEEQRVNHIK